MIAGIKKFFTKTSDKSRTESAITKLSDDKDFHAKLNMLEVNSKIRTREFMKLAQDGVRYIYGHQIHTKRKEGWDYPVFNKLFADNIQEVAILTANKPKLFATPLEDTDEAVAQACGQILQAYWGPKKLNMLNLIYAALLDAKTAGIYIFKWWWDRKRLWDSQQRRYRGDLCMQVVNPMYFGFDPNVEIAARIPFDARYIVTERYMEMDEAAQHWPVYAEYLREVKGMKDVDGPYWIPGAGDDTTDETGADAAAGEFSGREVTEHAQDVFQRRLADILVGKPIDEVFTETRQTGSMVKVQEFFWKCNEDEVIEDEYEPFQPPHRQEGGPAGWSEGGLYKDVSDPNIYDRNKPLYNDNGVLTGHGVFDSKTDKWPQRLKKKGGKIPKWPNGRNTVRIDDEVIVQDEAWPYSQWPFAVGVNYMLPHVANGLNGVELARQLQDYLNNVGCHFLNFIKHHSDPEWLAEEDVFDTVRARKDKAKGGIVIPNNAGAVIVVKSGAIRQKKLERLKAAEIPSSLFQIFDVLENMTKHIVGVWDVAHGKTTKGEQTLGEIAMLNRNTRLRVGLQGMLLDGCLQQVGQGSIEVLQRNLPVDSWVRILGEGEAAVKAATKWTQDMKTARMDVELEPGSTMPYDEEREIARYQAAFEAAGPAMLEALLKKLKIPNVEEILQNHDLLGALSALMEEAQAADKGPQEVMAALKQLLSSMKELNEAQAPQPAA